MNQPTITSLHNQRVKDAIHLRDRRGRARQGRILIDGAREILRAIGAGVHIAEAFIAEEFATAPDAQLAAAALERSAGEVWHVTRPVFEKLAFGQRLEGVLAVAVPPYQMLAEWQVPRGGLVAVLARVEKPGNVGAVLRSADAAGVAGVIVADPATDLYNSNAIRASLGTIFTMRVCETTTSGAIDWLRARACRIYAAQLDATQPYTAVDFRGDAAIVLGSEAEGLAPEWRAAGAVSIKLPMCGVADSLNVSAAAAALFYEALRQRGLPAECI